MVQQIRPQDLAKSRLINFDPDSFVEPKPSFLSRHLRKIMPIEELKKTPGCVVFYTLTNPNTVFIQTVTTSNYWIKRGYGEQVEVQGVRGLDFPQVPIADDKPPLNVTIELTKDLKIRGRKWTRMVFVNHHKVDDQKAFIDFCNSILEAVGGNSQPAYLDNPIPQWAPELTTNDKTES